MITFRTQVRFVLQAIDERPYPGSIQPAYELLSFGTDLVAVLGMLITLLALGRIMRGIAVSVWDWAVVGWSEDLRLIGEAVRLLFYPKGFSYGAIS